MQRNSVFADDQSREKRLGQHGDLRGNKGCEPDGDSSANKCKHDRLGKDQTCNIARSKAQNLECGVFCQSFTCRHGHRVRHHRGLVAVHHELLIAHREPALEPASGVEHEWDGEHSGEAWQQGPVILAWPGVLASGGWEGYNLVIHELAHKLDMLNGDANGLPPLHHDMRVQDWARVMQGAYDELNRQLDANPDAETAIDPYAAENPAEFFAVTSEYFFSAPDLLAGAFPAVYAQLALFYRQDPLARLQQLQASNPDYQVRTEDSGFATNG